MHYFVTGATGFVGGHVARRLVAAGHRVTALVRDPGRAGDLAALGIALAPGDVTERASLAAPMRGVDGVFHIAGWYKLGERDRSAGYAVNVEGTRNVLETMRDLGIAKGVYTSTLAVNSDTHGRLVDESYRYDGPHISEYDRTKWLAHYEVARPLARAGLPLVTVLPGLIYGPGDASPVHRTLVHFLQRKLPAMLPVGTAFCWGYIDDIAAAHVTAMERGRPGEDYIIAGPPHTLIEAVELAESLTGIPGPRRRAAPGMLKAMAALTSVVERVVPVPEDYRSEILRVNAGTTYLGDNAKARREWGYAPRPLKEGLAVTLDYERRRLAAAPAA